jgi:hypothetical protein
MAHSFIDFLAAGRHRLELSTNSEPGEVFEFRVGIPNSFWREIASSIASSNHVEDAN